MRFEHHHSVLHGRQLLLTRDDDHDRWFVYDSATGAFCMADPSLAGFLKRHCRESPPGIPEAEENDGFEAAAALTALEAKLGSSHLDAAEKTEPMATIALGVEEGCNLACTYCYNGNHFAREKAGRMEFDLAMEAIDQALRPLAEGAQLTVQLIGGEPLLQMPMLRRLIPAAEVLAAECGKTVRFSMNTNGLGLVKSTLRFLKEHRVGIAISIDGSERQNVSRVYPGNRQSYSQLRERIRDFIEEFEGVTPALTCRITAGSASYDFVEAVSHVVGLGFNNVGVGIALSGILEAAGRETDEAAGVLTRGLRRLKDYCLSEYRQGRFFRVSIFNDTMFTLYAHRPKFVPCGAVRRYAGVSASGDVVPCHRYIGSNRKDRILGNLRDKGTLGSCLEVSQRSSSLSHLPFGSVGDDRSRQDGYACSSCWARHLCGGECYEVRDVLGDGFGSLKPPMCEIKRSIFKFAIEMMIELRGSQEALFTQLMRMNAALKPKGPVRAHQP